MLNEFLKSIPLFHDLSEEELSELVEAGQVGRYPEGTVILTEGTPGGQLHVIHEGRIRISKVVPSVGEEALAILEPGDFFGEVEFFDGGPASAHAIAHTDCEILSIPHAEMAAFIRSRPLLSARFLWAFGRTLAVRLREMNQKMVTLFAISRTF